MIPGPLERLGDLIWKMKHHDEIILDLEDRLEKSETENGRLRDQVERQRVLIEDLRARLRRYEKP